MLFLIAAGGWWCRALSLFAVLACLDFLLLITDCCVAGALNSSFWVIGVQTRTCSRYADSISLCCAFLRIKLSSLRSLYFIRVYALLLVPISTILRWDCSFPCLYLPSLSGLRLPNCPSRVVWLILYFELSILL